MEKKKFKRYFVKFLYDDDESSNWTGRVVLEAAERPVLSEEVVSEAFHWSSSVNPRNFRNIQYVR